MVLKQNKTGKPGLLGSILHNPLLYFMMLPGIVWALLFCYVPLYGALMAFKDYSPRLGILGSPWVGLKHFRDLFEGDFLRILRNTLVISGGTLLAGFPAPILLALLVSGVKNRVYRRIAQTLSYVPHFVSWVVVSSICFIFFAPVNGFINVLLRNLGLIEQSIGFLENGPSFVLMLIIVNVWKSTGFSAIIYFAAIVSVDEELYEAAILDGAGRLQRTWKITIPCIMPTITVMLVLAVANLMNAGFEQQMVMANNLVWDWADVIDTYAYRYGLTQLRYSYGTAVGLFKSLVALLLLTGANAFVKRQTGYSLYR
jgi:putative aldouronate transport system permease protein